MQWLGHRMLKVLRRLYTSAKTYAITIIAFPFIMIAMILNVCTFTLEEVTNCLHCDWFCFKMPPHPLLQQRGSPNLRQRLVCSLWCLRYRWLIEILICINLLISQHLLWPQKYSIFIKILIIMFLQWKRFNTVSLFSSCT